MNHLLALIARARLIVITEELRYALTHTTHPQGVTISRRRAYESHRVSARSSHSDDRAARPQVKDTLPQP